MRSLFVILVFCWFAPIAISGLESEFVYAIRPIPGERGLEVELEFLGDESGETQLILPSSFMGEENLEQEVIGLHCLSASVEDTAVAHIKCIRHPPREPLKIAYRIQTKEQKKGFGRSYLEKSYFQFIGETFFITPKQEPKTEPRITLKWEDFPSDWILANSFGIQKTRQDLALSLSALKSGLYLGGEWNLLNCGTENHPVYIAQRKNSLLPEKPLFTLVQTIIHSQRAFWQDADFPEYLVSICEVDPDQYEGGTAVPNALTVFIRSSLLSETKWRWLETTLSHEHFHTWNALKIRFDEDANWFMEGFTEFYALTLNHREKLLDLSAYVKEINRALETYFASPVRNATSREIQELFWKDGNILKLPYIKGPLLALYWDRKIRAATGGERSLDDVMRALLEESRAKKNRRFSQKDLQTFLEKYIENASRDMESFIVRGETLPVDPQAFEGFTLEWSEGLTPIPQYIQK